MYNNYNNPYYNPTYRPIEPQFNQMQQNIPPMQQNTLQVPKNMLQGELVETIEMAKNIKTNLDGSISYLPLVDGSAIVTKQLQNDGTSKITVFKPITEKKEEIKYITQDDLKKAIEKLNLDDIEEELKELRKQLKKKGE